MGVGQALENRSAGAGLAREAIRFWERGRIAYNLALTALVCFWVARTWPHFRPALTLGNLLRLLVLAVLANVCYSAAYLVEVVLSESDGWRRRRWILWAAGTLFALLIAHYWIGDEIYPSVPAA